MNSIKRSFAYVLFFSIFAPLFGQDPTLIIKPINDTTYDVSITIHIEENDAVYESYLDVSVDNPPVSLSEFKPSIQPDSLYDATFKETKKLFTKTVTLSLQATALEPIDAIIHLNYYPRSQKRIIHQMFPVSFVSSEPDFAQIDHQLVEKEYHASKNSQPLSWPAYFSSLLASADS